MRKILILSLHLGFGGIEKSVCSLANMLCDKYDVEIASCYKLYDECAFHLDDRVKVVYLNDSSIVPNRDKLKSSIKKLNLFKFIKECFFSIKVLYLRKRKVISYLKDSSYDVVISTRDFLNTLSSKYAKGSALKVGWEHNHFHDNYKYADKIVKSVSKLDVFINVSSALNEYYSSRLNKSNVKCYYVPNCIDEMPDKSSLLNSTHFISVGRLSTEKGYLDLLKIMVSLKEKYPKWILDIVGDGDQFDVLSEFIKNNDLDGNVVLHGFQNKDYINNLLNKSSIYLMSSYTESFGIVLIEAMSHGVPCVAFTSAEGACEIIEDSKNGFLVDNRDFEKMIEKISLLVDDRKKRIEMGEYARKSVVKYTSDIVSKQWIKIFEESGINE